MSSHQLTTLKGRVLLLFLSLGLLLLLIVLYLAYLLLFYDFWVSIPILFLLVGLFVLGYRLLLKPIIEQDRQLQRTQLQLKENVALLEELKIAYKLLESEYFMIDNSVLFASYRADMTVISMSGALKALLGLDMHHKITGFIQDFFPVDEYQHTHLVNVLKNNRHYMLDEELVFKGKNGEMVCLSLLLMPFNHKKYGSSTFFTAVEITRYKKNEQEIAELKQEEYNDHVAVQKEQTTQVVAAQEQERERIAKDIHDGIGQVLTALKITLESIDFENLNAAVTQKILHLKKVFAQLIKDVRTVTFNLNLLNCQIMALWWLLSV